MEKMGISLESMEETSNKNKYCLFGNRVLDEWNMKSDEIVIMKKEMGPH